MIGRFSSSCFRQTHFMRDILVFVLISWMMFRSEVTWGLLTPCLGTVASGISINKSSAHESLQMSAALWWIHPDCSGPWETSYNNETWDERERDSSYETTWILSWCFSLVQTVEICVAGLGGVKKGTWSVLILLMDRWLNTRWTFQSLRSVTCTRVLFLCHYTQSIFLLLLLNIGKGNAASKVKRKWLSPFSYTVYSLNQHNM